MAASKRPHLANNSNKSLKKPKLSPSQDPNKPKRKFPITRPGGRDSEDEFEVTAEGFVDVDVEVGQQGQQGQQVEVTQAALFQAGNAREAHQLQKQLKQDRKALKPHATLLSRAKLALSALHSAQINKTDKLVPMRELMGVITGSIRDVVFKHDACRIVQAVLKCGSRADREVVASELDGSWVALLQDKYTKFLVTKVIRYCPSYRPKILAAVTPTMTKLIHHKSAGTVLEDFFSLYASSAEKKALVRGLYGREFALFPGSEGKTLQELISLESKPKAQQILQNVRFTLQNIFDKPDDGGITYSLVHRTMWEYLSCLDLVYEQEEADKKRRDMLESCQELLAEIVHSRDGSRVVREFIVQGNAKDRKIIMKTLKSFFLQICKDDQAQLVLFTAFDCIDDTKLLKTSLFPDLIKFFSTLSKDKIARRVIFYLLCPRASRHFTVATVRILEETDPARARTSKKDPEVRQKELREGLGAAVVKHMAENMESMLRNTGESLVVLEAMLALSEADRSPAVEAMIELSARPYKASIGEPNLETAHILDLSHSSRAYKGLIQGGHFVVKDKAVDVVDADLAASFTSQFWTANNNVDNIVPLACGHAAFVILEMINKLKGTPVEEEVRSVIDSEAQAKILASKSKGSDLLVASLN